MVGIAVLLSLVTTYFYGLQFSHPRYWEGTVERVVFRQAEFIRTVVDEFNDAKAFPKELTRVDRLFKPLDGKIVVELFDEGRLVWSNRNSAYSMGSTIETLPVFDNRVLVISRYEPPAWKMLFVRWMKSPSRWGEPSFDFITAPFAWFFSVYLLSIFCIAYAVKAAYLEKDVLKIFQSIEKRYGQ